MDRELDDLERNLANLMDAAELTTTERHEWAAQYSSRVMDWRNHR